MKLKASLEGILDYFLEGTKLHPKKAMFLFKIFNNVKTFKICLDLEMYLEFKIILMCT